MVFMKSFMFVKRDFIDGLGMQNLNNEKRSHSGSVVMTLEFFQLLLGFFLQLFLFRKRLVILSQEPLLLCNLSVYQLLHLVYVPNVVPQLIEKLRYLRLFHYR